MFLVATPPGTVEVLSRTRRPQMGKLERNELRDAHVFHGLISDAEHQEG